eukprot:CAMPEP_0194132832 /NCGR_PEP_ID=MMETSP0152-20130528/3208_1 /TAXON_ID=1049557 /ORGANISM="Thalassiothrix antarctica, Strain L6-D1" /LENGTH=261 /DNA_ID=CAMNT_0038828009 /DNA_START=83 /DNA_END=868 /DNA_ORIENTATION=-
MNNIIVANQFDDADESSPKNQWAELVHSYQHIPLSILSANPVQLANICQSSYTGYPMRDAISVVSSDSNDDIPSTITSLSPEWVNVKLANSPVSDDSSVENDNTGSAYGPTFLIPPGVTENDVLCGRGKGANNFVGNRRFRDIVMRYRYLYSNCSRRSDKRAICNHIVEAVHAHGGRFLTRVTRKNVDNASPIGSWTTLGQEKILVKVSQALREGVAKWNKVTQKYEADKARNVEATRTRNPGVAFLAEISSIHSGLESTV